MLAILAVCTDLFFIVKIQDAARRAGFDVKFSKTADDLTDAPLVVVDLNCRDLDVIALIRAIKSTSTIPVLGFLSHVEADLAKSAKEAGCDRVLARSAFSSRGADILKEMT